MGICGCCLLLSSESLIKDGYWINMKEQDDDTRPLRIGGKNKKRLIEMSTNANEDSVLLNDALTEVLRMPSNDMQ